jgi:diguanylate cyclase
MMLASVKAIMQRGSQWLPWPWRKTRGDTALVPALKPQNTPESLARDGRIKRIKIIAWATLIAGICGAIEFGRPLEDVIQAGRDAIRAKPVPQDIVVVGIDDKTVKQLGSVDFPRRHLANAVDTLFEQGARRVYFDMAFAYVSDPQNDKILADTFARHKGRVYIGAMRQGNRTATTIVPQPMFARTADIVSLNARKTPFQLNMRFASMVEIDGTARPSMAASLAQTSANAHYFKPDWAMRLETVPTISMSSVLQPTANLDVMNKDVVVAHSSWSGRDVHLFPGQGWWPGAHFHVIAAQTLKQGHPETWGWWPAFAFALITASILAMVRKLQNIHSVSVLTIVALFGLPLIADAHLVTIDVVPALLLISIAYYRIRALRRLEVSQVTNASTGRATVNILRGSDRVSSETLIALKIRNFADIDASFGHSVEAPLIGEICRRMAAIGITGEVHHGEDSLVWFMPPVAETELASHLEGLRNLLIAPIRIGARQIDALVSFGADSDFDAPISSRVGSALMCATEAADENQLWKHYEPSRRRNADWELSLLGQLDDAIESGAVWIAYQPQYHFGADVITGAEALARWDHPERGAISPDEFISMAERHDRIDKLTWFVLDRAIATAAEINRQGRDFSISVNISAKMLANRELINKVRIALAHHRLSARQLMLEITETSRIPENSEAAYILNILIRMGVRLSIDDYGTGFATLDYFRTIPATEIKIDRRFIANLNPGAPEMILVASTIAMAHSMGCAVVAEGVEQQREFDVLHKSGCDLAQGYLIARPMPRRDLEALIMPIAKRASG